MSPGTSPGQLEKRALVLIVLVAIGLHLPTVTWGFFLDDHGQQLAFEGEVTPPTMTRVSVFDFGYAPRPGEPFFETGAFPWWTSADWKARFFRPLTSLSLALDQALFGRRAWLHHLTSLGLYALVLAAAWRLYRIAGCGPPAALMGLLIFACEDGSALVVGWLANRNSLLEALFGALALGCALRARGGGVGARSAWLAVACAALATLAKESGVVVLAVVCLALWRPARAASLASGALALAHVAFLYLADYGVRAALYPTPWIPGGLWPWLENLAFTLTVQPLAAVSPFPVDLIAFDPTSKRAALLVGLVATPVLMVLVWRVARRIEGAGWLALWGLLDLLPQSLAPASDRLAFVPALCFAPLVAAYLWRHLRRGPDTRPGMKLLKVPAGVLALACLPLSALMLGVRASVTGHLMHEMERVALDAELRPFVGPPSAGMRDVLVLQYPNATAGFGAQGTWAFETGDRRTRWHSLQFLGRGLEWTRIDDRTMDFKSLGEPFAAGVFETVFVSTALPPEVGQRWRTVSFEVEAREVGAKGLRTVRLTFDRPVDDGHPVFLTWTEDRLGRIEAPPVGEPYTLVPAPPLIDYVP